MSTSKKLLEAGLAHLGRLGISSRRVRGNTLILAYHNIVPDGALPDGDRPLHLPYSVFCRHMDVLTELTEVVPLSDINNPDARGPRAVVTFDDAYSGAVNYALPELARRGLASTVFVAPAYLGGATFWWDDAARSANGMLHPSIRDEALHAWRGREDEVRGSLSDLNVAAKAASAPLRCCSVEDLRRAVAEGPVVLGSHTWTHPNLTRLSADELESELSRPLAWLLKEFPAATIPFLSYPYGLVSGAVRTAVIAAGYRGAMLVMGGWAGVEFDQFAIPRKNVPAGLSANGLALRLTGLIRP